MLRRCICAPVTSKGKDRTLCRWALQAVGSVSILVAGVPQAACVRLAGVADGGGHAARSGQGHCAWTADQVCHPLAARHTRGMPAPCQPQVGVAWNPCLPGPSFADPQASLLSSYPREARKHNLSLFAALRQKVPVWLRLTVSSWSGAADIHIDLHHQGCDREWCRRCEHCRKRGATIGCRLERWVASGISPLDDAAT